MEQDIIKMCLQERQPFPDPIKNAPEILPGLDMYLSAFWDLHSCRQLGFGVGPIAWTATNQYATMLELSPEETWEFHFLIKRLDGAYLEWRSQQDKK